ncbi:MAG: thiamine pyrophosphate-dependent enzyme [Thermoplasmatota archaeon]
MAATTTHPIAISEYKVDTKPTWCPGCGDYGVLTGILKATSQLGIEPKDLVVVSGIGCSSNLPHFLKSYGFHSIHGRSIPVATGVRLANPDLKVVVTGGDGDGYGIGLGHFLHAMRRNLDLTYVVMNNEIYGLTTGQTSPTSLVGMKSKSTPLGNLEHPLNPVALALASGATFVARGFSGDPKSMPEILERAIAHKGFSLVDVQSPCVTYNKLNTYDYFRDRVYNLQEQNHDPSNFEAAVMKAMEWPTNPDGKVPIGIFYERDLPTYEAQDVALSTFGPPAKQKLGLSREQKATILDSLL